MAYDDFGGGAGGFSLFGGDTPDYGTSFDFGPGAGGFSLFGGDTPAPFDFGPLSGPMPPVPSVAAQPAAPFGLGPQGLQALGAGLGALGPLAGLLGTLAGGGVTGQTTPHLTTAQRAFQTQGGQALGALNPFVAGQSPLQLQQAGILNALSPYLQNLMTGQGAQSLINTLSPLIQQAYQPFVQGLYGQAAEAGRRAGFYDSPATAPPGGAILGPGLAQLQGQQAQSLLQALLTQIPQAAISGAGAFNQPVNQQLGAAQTQATGYGNLIGPIGTQQSQPLGPSIGQGLGSVIGGAAQGLSGVLQQQQQQQFQNSLLNALQSQRGPQGGLSYTG